MSDKITLKPIAAALGTTFAVTLAASPLANAAENPFGLTNLGSGYMVAEEGKCGEAKCGADMAKETEEGACGGEKAKETEEGACGGEKAKDAEEGACGGEKAKDAEEGACGGEKAKDAGEGACGGEK